MNDVLARTRSETCVSDLRLDKLIVGELESGAERAAREHLDGCSLCSGRLSALVADREAYRATHRALPSRHAPEGSKRKVFFVASSVAMLAAAAAFMLVVRVPSTHDGQLEDATRTKGGAAIGFYVKEGDVVREGANGEVVHPGDSLRFTYTVNEPRYLAILSLDGAGTASVYFPSSPTAVRVAPGRDEPLPSSTILDDVRGTERVYALFCREAVALEPVRIALQARTDEVSFPDGCDVETLRIEKH